MASDLQTPDQRRSAAVWIVLWLTLLAYGFIAAPIPGVNEPHYLGKAKHFWNPAWCPGDLLLESSNAHLVFYVTVGFWSQWLPLPLLALFGRLVGYGLLARGWQRTHEVLGLNGWLAWRSLLVFLALASWGNFSGEWLVGGIEGKVFSYACLMLAFADWQVSRLNCAALWAGLAISFHPVVGMWAVLAAALAELTLQMFRLARFREPEALARDADSSSLASASGSLQNALIALVLLSAAAAPGLIPALGLIVTHDPDHVRTNGTYLQVYYRLAHHLDPMGFPVRSYACYAGLCLVVIALHRSLSRLSAGRAWFWIVFWSAMFALAGIAAGYGPRPAKEMWLYLERMKLLKFYPFRLFDVLTPITVAMQVTLGFDWITEIRSCMTRSIGALAATAGLLAIIATGVDRQIESRPQTVFQSPEWLDVCHWVREHTPADVLIQSPDRNPNFKWHAGRAEYVTYKDVPQDNAGLVEWNRRLKFLRKWYHDHNPDGYSVEELRALRAESGIDFILTDHLGPFDVPPRYTNGVFRVYDLTQFPE